jgi:hypothetical protein
MSPRVLLTMSRKWKRWSQVREVLTEIHRRYPDAVLVHGDCPDGDRTAAGIWKSLGGTDEPHPADWKAFGRAAGFRRNAAMVESGVSMVVAFIVNNSRGATHCADLAEGAGITTVRYEYEEAV